MSLAPRCTCACNWVGEEHLPGCPRHACRCGRGGAPAHLDQPHRPDCLLRRLPPLDTGPAVAARLAKADALLAKNAEARLLLRRLRVSLTRVDDAEPVEPPPLTSREVTP